MLRSKYSLTLNWVTVLPVSMWRLWELRERIACKNLVYWELGHRVSYRNVSSPGIGSPSCLSKSGVIWNWVTVPIACKNVHSITGSWVTALTVKMGTRSS